MEYHDKVLKCAECSAEFVFTAGEQMFFADKGFKNEPKRCKACKSKPRAGHGTARVRRPPTRRNQNRLLAVRQGNDRSLQAHPGTSRLLPRVLPDCDGRWVLDRPAPSAVRLRSIVSPRRSEKHEHVHPRAASSRSRCAAIQEYCLDLSSSTSAKCLRLTPNFPGLAKIATPGRETHGRHHSPRATAKASARAGGTCGLGFGFGERTRKRGVKARRRPSFRVGNARTHSYRPMGHSRVQPRCQARLARLALRLLAKKPAPQNSAAWEKSVKYFQHDREEMVKLVMDPKTDLTAPIPHGSGQTILREALLVADHNSYHLGQFSCSAPAE